MNGDITVLLVHGKNSGDQHKDLLYFPTQQTSQREISDPHSTSSNNSNENSDNSSSGYANDMPVEDITSNVSDTLNMDTTTSLSERIDVYKDITDTNYTLNKDSGFLYKTNVDWGKINVSDTEEHKS